MDTKLYHLICKNSITGRTTRLTEYPVTYKDVMTIQSKQSDATVLGCTPVLYPTTAEAVYLDWFNNYLSFEVFCQAYVVNPLQVMAFIDQCRTIYQKQYN